MIVSLVSGFIVIAIGGRDAASILIFLGIRVITSFMGPVRVSLAVKAYCAIEDGFSLIFRAA